jgi:hypothetical protein
MGPLSELGGMEPIRRHPLLPRDEAGQPLPISLGEIRALMQFLSDHSASGVAADENPVTTDDSSVLDEAAGKERPRTTKAKVAFEPDVQAQVSTGAGQRMPQLHPSVLTTLLHQIHPLVIAHLQQNDTLSREISEKALRLHLHAEDPERIRRLVDLFNGGFHSPLYTASRAELVDAGLPVVTPDKELWGSIWGLVQLYQATLYSDRPEASAPGAFFRYVCLLEAVGRLTGLRQTFTQSDGQERVLQIRWDTAIRGPGPGPSFGPGGRSNN